MAKLVLLIILCGILTGCNSSDSFLLLQSKYNTYIPGENTTAGRKLNQSLQQAGLKLITETVETEGDPAQMLDQVYNMIEKPGVKYIMPDPLLNLPLAQMVSKYPALLFIVQQDNKNMQSPNLLNIQYNKIAALSKAGRITAELLQQKYSLLQERQVPGEKLKIGLIYHQFLPDQIEEINAFKEAFTSAYGANELLVEEVRDINDRNEINSKVDKFIRNGVVLIFPRLYFSNSYCLDLCIKKGSLVIIENWRFPSTSSDNRTLFTGILFSIDDAFTDALLAVLQVKSGKENQVSSWEQPQLLVNSRITWNPALTVPAEIKKILAEYNTGK